MRDIERAAEMSPEDQRYGKHKEILRTAMGTKLLLEEGMVESVLQRAEKRLVRKQSGRSLGMIVGEGDEDKQPLELRVLKKYGVGEITRMVG